MERYSAELDAELDRFLPFIRAVENATSEDQVLGSVRDCLKELSREELTRLPEDCWPGRLATNEDLAAYCIRLAERRAQPGNNLRDRMLVVRISLLVTNAVKRVARLSHAAAEASGGA